MQMQGRDSFPFKKLEGPGLEKTRPKIVAVDGPAGSGKSSICAEVCNRIGWTYINTGAIYRAVGLVTERAGLDLSDESAVAKMVDKMAPMLRWNAHSQQLWYDDQNLTPLLGTEEAGRAASKIAKLPLVRERLLPVQRQLTLAAPVGALVDGRDIGTVVFPDADLKVFLTASLEERSKRRLSQLANDVESESARKLLEDIKVRIAGRDEQDQARGVAPLKQAADAVILDSSSMTLEQVIETLVRILRDHQLI